MPTHAFPKVNANGYHEHQAAHFMFVLEGIGIKAWVGDFGLLHPSRMERKLFNEVCDFLAYFLVMYSILGKGMYL